MDSVNKFIVSINDDIETNFIDSIKNILIFLIEQKTIDETYMQPENITITSSSGNSVCIIFHQLDEIYQIYPNKELYIRMKNLCEKLSENYTSDNNSSITHHKYVIDQLQCIIYQKIKPINNFGYNFDIMKKEVTENYQKIIRDITTSLEFLHGLNISHGDPTIDNIGYNQTTNTYVLFDYDKSKLNCDIYDMNRDYYILQKSVKSYL